MLLRGGGADKRPCLGGVRRGDRHRARHVRVISRRRRHRRRFRRHRACRNRACVRASKRASATARAQGKRSKRMTLVMALYAPRVVASVVCAHHRERHHQSALPPMPPPPPPHRVPQLRVGQGLTDPAPAGRLDRHYTGTGQATVVRTSP